MAGLKDLLLDHERGIDDAIAKTETQVSARRRRQMMLRSKRDEISEVLRAAGREHCGQKVFGALVKIVLAYHRTLDREIARGQDRVSTMDRQLGALERHRAEVQCALGSLSQPVSA